MKDWKAAVRTWERNGYSNKPTDQTQKGFDSDEFFQAAVRRSEAYLKKHRNSPRAKLEREVIERNAEKAPPKTAAEDEEIRIKMEQLRERLGG